LWLNKKILFLLIMQCFIGTWLKNHGSHILPQFSHHPYLTILIIIIIDHDFIFLIEWLEYMMMSVHLYANITWYPKSNFKSIFFFQIREKWRRRGDHVCMCMRARVYIYIYMCVCVCVCVCREAKRPKAKGKKRGTMHIYGTQKP
jgi:hypothetical protein